MISERLLSNQSLDFFLERPPADQRQGVVLGGEHFRLFCSQLARDHEKCLVPSIFLDLYSFV